jgi:hypothetical protein
MSNPVEVSRPTKKKKERKKEMYLSDWVQWLTPVISATWKVETGGSQFEASLGKTLVRPYSTISQVCWGTPAI